MYVHEEKDSIILEYIKRSWDRKHAPSEWHRKVICIKQNKADVITNCKMPLPHRSFATSPVAHLGAGPFPPPLAMRRWWNHNLTLKKLRPPRTGIFGPIVSSLLGIQLGPLDAKGHLVQESGNLIPFPKICASVIGRQDEASVGLLGGEKDVALCRRTVRWTTGEDSPRTETGDGLPRPSIVGASDGDDLNILGGVRRIGKDFRESAETLRVGRGDLQRPARRKIHGNCRRPRIRASERLDHIGG